MKVSNGATQRRDGDRRRRDAEDPRGTARRRAAAGTPQRVRSRAGRDATDRDPRTRRGSSPRTAPDRDLRPRGSGPRTAPGKPAAVRVAKNAGQAKARAKARKAKQPKVIRVPLRERLLARLVSIDLRPQALAARVPFVVVIIGSLGIGLGLTLWLSTDSAERSYELGAARKGNQLLLQQKEALERDVLEAEAAPALAEAARNLGMIPSRDTAHLIQDPAGNWVVVGSPKPADGVPPPPLNVRLPDEQPAAAPKVNPVEVPVRVQAGPQARTAPAGPEVLVRTDDGATTLGEQHQPVPAPAAVPAPIPAPELGPAPETGPAPELGPEPEPAPAGAGLVLLPVSPVSPEAAG